MNARRLALGGALTAGALAVTPGVAMADIHSFNVDGSGEDEFVLDANNDRVANGDFGPKIAFTVDFRCDNGERIGIGVIAWQNPEGEDPRAFGGVTRTCTGSTQTVNMVLERRPASPNFDSDRDVQYQGFAVTDLNEEVDSISESGSVTNPDN